jgi:hypothetical protein
VVWCFVPGSVDVEKRRESLGKKRKLGPLHGLIVTLCRLRGGREMGTWLNG